MDNTIHTSSKVLIELQSNLIALAQSLNECYEILSQNVIALNDDWQDEKYEEFASEFHSTQEQIHEISESYSDWANKKLQEAIDKAIEYENLQTGIGH